MTTLNEDVQRTAVPDRGPIAAIRRGWARFDAKHHGIAEFIMFFIVCNAVTVLQLVLMPVFKWLFGLTPAGRHELPGAAGRP
ncbi:hypothetical protein [Bifidobacterium sp. SO4]|uniref:hypothetical protein n=1 Tax=Bifidobacterium sp. SO4 TaxID=2809030 RepID=UPI001F0AD3A7|nr:hypothetical protein [Bifidobacterium sp. SO4]